MLYQGRTVIEMKHKKSNLVASAILFINVHFFATKKNFVFKRKGPAAPLIQGYFLHVQPVTDQPDQVGHI